MKTITVAVFSEQGKRGLKYRAYTLTYNPSWPGCCLHDVEAANGTEAKLKAIHEHKSRCAIK